MMPVTGEQPFLHRPTVEREPHVRASIVDCVRSVTIPEHADRLRAGFGGEPPGLLQLCERPGIDAHRRPPNCVTAPATPTVLTIRRPLGVHVREPRRRNRP